MKRLDSFNEILLRLARPAGFVLLAYCLVIDRDQIPTVLPGAITLIGLQTIVGRKERS